MMIKTSGRYFLAVIEAGSIRAASQKLRVNQAAISRQIKILEEDLGLPILERHSRGVKTTPAGDLLWTSLRDINYRIQRLTSDIDSLRGMALGRVRIHTVETMAELVIPNLLDRFASEFPGIQLDVMMSTSDKLNDALVRGEADLALTFSSVPNSQVRKIVSRPDRVVALFRPDHPLCEKPILQISDLKPFRLGLATAPTTLRLQFDEACRQAAIPLESAFTSNSISLLRHFAKGEECLAITNYLAFNAQAQRAGLTHRFFLEPQLNCGQIEVLVLANRQPPIAVEKAIEYISLQFDELNR